MRDIVERDIYEVANQLGSYVGPNTPPDLKDFLVREAAAAAELADEITRLRRELADARNAVLEEAALIASNFGKDEFLLSPHFTQGVGYASQGIALEIEELMHSLKEMGE